MCNIWIVLFYLDIRMLLFHIPSMVTTQDFEIILFFVVFWGFYWHFLGSTCFRSHYNATIAILSRGMKSFIKVAIKFFEWIYSKYQTESLQPCILRSPLRTFLTVLTAGTKLSSVTIRETSLLVLRIFFTRNRGNLQIHW